MIPKVNGYQSLHTTLISLMARRWSAAANWRKCTMLHRRGGLH